MSAKKQAMTVHELQENGETFYVVVDHNGNFFAKTYFRPDAVKIAALPELLDALNDSADIIQQYYAYAETMREIGRGFSPESSYGIGDNPAQHALTALEMAQGKATA